MFSCTVLRDDGKAPSSKKLLCTLTSLDADGNAIQSVPVDRKIRF